MLFLEKLNQNKICIFLVIIICLFAGIFYSFKFTPKEAVSSSTMMLIKIENEDEKAGGLELTNNLISTFEEIAKSELTVTEVKNNLKLNIESKELTNKIDLKRVSSSDTFKIEIIDENSEKAIKINKEIINVFSDKIQDMYGDTEVYIIDTPHITQVKYSNSFILPIAISILLGIIINVLYITVLLVLDKRIKKSFDIESDLFLKTLAEVPLKKSKDKNIKSELIAYESEKSESSKAFKNLRTNIQFLCVNNSANKKVVLITSAMENEGKSYIAANMAVSFAEIGKKVLLLDADMNDGKQSKIFNIPNNLGLSNYLSNLDINGVEVKNEFLNKFVNETAIKNLNLITSGTIPPNSSELLTSQKLIELIKDLKVFYDIVIIDGTSVLNSTDALILARAVNSTIIVSNCNKTKKEDIQKAKRDIQNVGGRIIGVVLNKVKIKKEKKSFNQRKEEFVKFRINVKDKFREIKECIKNKLQGTNQKLLPEHNNSLKEEKKELVNNNENTSYTQVKKESIANTEKALNINDVKKNLTSNIKENFVQIKNKVLDLSKGVFDKKEKRDLNENVEKHILDEKTEQKQILEENTEHNTEANNENIEKEIVNQENTENSSKIKNSVLEKVKDLKNSGVEKTGILKNTIIEKSQKVKENTVNIYSKGKDFCVEKYNNIIESNKKVENNISTMNEKVNMYSEVALEENVAKDVDIKVKEETVKNAEILDEDVKNDNTILVIIDAENGYCRVFSKECFTEKLIRGIDRVDGFLKANYSSKMVSRRKNYLMETFKITEKQAERIDTLVYATLCDYDNSVWTERKLPSDKSEKYVYCMSKEYQKNPNESEKEYNARCRRLRKSELEKMEIDIEYKLDNLWKSNKINIFDKIAIKKFADSYEIDNSMKNDKEILRSKKNKKFYTDIITGAEKKLKKINNDEKRKEEKIIAEDRKVKQKELELEQEKIEEEKRAAQERIKQEQERIKAEKRKEKEIEKQERKEEAIRRRKEKQKQKEDLKIHKEMVREKQREEAKIEEELMEDNLYPKTKHNKNL